jgi:hypothetical protein
MTVDQAAVDAAFAAVDAAEPAAPEAAAEPTGQAAEPQETAPAEPATEPEKPEKPERKSTKIDQFAREELRLRKAQATLKSQQEALQAQMADVARHKEVMELAQKDPLEYLRKTGIDLNRLTKDLIDGKKPPAPDPRAEEIEALKRQFDEQKKASDEARQQAIAQAQARERRESAAYVTGNADLFPLLSAHEADDVGEAILTVMVRHYEQTETLLDRSAAAKLVEDRLQKQYERLHAAASKRKPTPPVAAVASDAKTLGKQHVSRATKTPEEMSASERRAYAMSLLDEMG